MEIVIEDFRMVSIKNKREGVPIIFRCTEELISEKKNTI